MTLTPFSAALSRAVPREEPSMAAMTMTWQPSSIMVSIWFSWVGTSLEAYCSSTS